MIYTANRLFSYHDDRMNTLNVYDMDFKEQMTVTRIADKRFNAVTVNTETQEGVQMGKDLNIDEIGEVLIDWLEAYSEQERNDVVLALAKFVFRK